MRTSPAKRAAVFIAVVFPLTWLVDLVNWRLGGPDNLIAFPLLMVLAMFIPGLTAAVMLDFVTKEGYRSAGLRWGAKRYIGIAYLIMLGVSAATYGLTLGLGLGRVDTGAATLQALLVALGVKASLPAPVLLGAALFSALTGAVLVNSTYALGEEMGWRGFLLPNLLHLGKVRACVITGAIWGLWHTPLILMGHLYPGSPYLGVLMMTVMCVFLSIIFGWLRLASNSLLPPIVAHAALNAQMLAYFPSFLVTGVDPLIGGGSGLLGLGIMGVVALWVLLSGRLR